jgi:hypothetical protein
MITRLLLAALALAVLVGCGHPVPRVPVDVPTITGPASTAPAPSTARAEPTPAPTGVEVPRVGIKSTVPLVGLDLDDDMHLKPPDVRTPQVGGWYKGGWWPGEPGPAVIAAHVSGRPPGTRRSVPGLFARLPQVRMGDQVRVRREDGSTLTFTVYRVEAYPKDRFDTAAVYGQTPGPELRLITCSGPFDEAAHSYGDNTVVFARPSAAPGD